MILLYLIYRGRHVMHLVHEGGGGRVKKKVSTGCCRGGNLEYAGRIKAGLHGLHDDCHFFESLRKTKIE